MNGNGETGEVETNETNETSTKIVFEFSTTIDVCIPGTGGHGIMKQALQAVNLCRLGRPLTLEDDEATLGDAYKALQEVHYRMHRTHLIPILVKVTEDGQLIVSIKDA